MPFIARQVRPPARQRVSCTLPPETIIQLRRYAEGLDSSKEYVVNDVLSEPFRCDAEFQTGLTAQPAADQHAVADAQADDSTPASRARS
jgi:hypothetical protein